jgi:hypothetical protein
MKASAQTKRLSYLVGNFPPPSRKASDVIRSRTALLLFAILLFSLSSAAREPLAELRKRADAARGSDCAKLCLEAAHALVEESFPRFKRGDAEAAQATLQDAMGYAQRGAQDALESKKRRKEVEISLRELERRLTDLARLLELEQRAPLESDIAMLEKLRSQLLSSLFNLKAEQE